MQSQVKKSKSEEEEEVFFNLDWDSFLQRNKLESGPQSTITSMRKGSSSVRVVEDENVLSDDDIFVETDGDASIRRDYLENEIYGHTQISSRHETSLMNHEAKVSHAHPVLTRQTPVIVKEYGVQDTTRAGPGVARAQKRPTEH